MSSNASNPWCEDRLVRVGMAGPSVVDHDFLEAALPDPEERANAWEAVRAIYERNDPFRLVNAFADAGVEVIVTHAKNHLGVVYFRSRMGRPLSLMGDSDWLAAVGQACQDRGLALVAQFQASYDTRQARTHPDWTMRDRHGRSTGKLCINQPAWRVYLHGLIREVVEGYPVAGVNLDELVFLCHCPLCARRFRQETGYDLPIAEDWADPAWRRFTRWRYGCVRDFLTDTRRVVTDARPDVTLSLTAYCASHGTHRSGQRIADLAASLDYLNVDLRGGVRAGETARRFRAFSRLRPEVWLNGITDVGLEHGRSRAELLYGKPRVEYMIDAMSIVASGAAVNIDTHERDRAAPALRKKMMTMIRDVAAEVRKRKPWMGPDCRPVRYAAVLFSEASRDYFGAARGDERIYRHEYAGAYTALLTDQVLVESLGEVRLSPDGLAGLRVLVLPNTYALSDSEARAVRGFVEGGGGLVATHQTSLADADGTRRDDFALADLFGVTYRSRADETFDFAASKQWAFDHHLRTMGAWHPVTDGVFPGEVTFTAPWLQVALRPGATALAEVVDRMDFAASEHYPAGTIVAVDVFRETGIPAVTALTYGRGRVVWFNSTIGALASVNAHPAARRLFLNAVDWAGGPRPVAVDAPSCVEATAFRDDGTGRLVVHLVNHHAVLAGHTGDLHPVNVMRREFRPVTGIRVAIDGTLVGAAPGRVYRAPEQTDLDARLADDRLVCALDRLEHHAMVVIEGLLDRDGAGAASAHG